MKFITIVLLILVIALVLSLTGLHSSILIKDLDVKRYYIVLFVLMMLALIFARIIEAKTQSFIAGLFSGPMLLMLGFLPVIYIDYLKKKKSHGYQGIWKKAGDWLDQPIKTLFMK